MSHYCPHCGQTCYCGGDIDDCCFDNDAEVSRCNHCPDPDDVDRSEDDQPGCVFPGECCMPGPHVKGECHTAKMIEDQFNQMPASVEKQSDDSQQRVIGHPNGGVEL